MRDQRRRAAAKPEGATIALRPLLHRVSGGPRGHSNRLSKDITPETVFLKRAR